MTKSASLPAVRCYPSLRSDIEGVLDAGDTISDLVLDSVRSTVAWRRTQDAFLPRSRQAIDQARREGSGISPEQLLRRMDDRLDQARQQLASRRGSPASKG